MGTTEPLDDLKYWAEKLDRTRAKMTILRCKYMSSTDPVFHLTHEELYTMMNHVTENAVNVHFLIQALAEYEAALKEKKPFWKKLFRK